ncbi:MAG TPA: hypothetical protein VHF89_11535 [Solirubrobacteraceae bacterium]|nr:hypothetical protein [Solirubrobacteraceae bacterium]
MPNVVTHPLSARVLLLAAAAALALSVAFAIAMAEQRDDAGIRAAERSGASVAADPDLRPPRTLEPEAGGRRPSGRADGRERPPRAAGASVVETVRAEVALGAPSGAD